MFQALLQGLHGNLGRAHHNPAQCGCREPISQLMKLRPRELSTLSSVTQLVKQLSCRLQPGSLLLQFISSTLLLWSEYEAIKRSILRMEKSPWELKLQLQKWNIHYWKIKLKQYARKQNSRERKGKTIWKPPTTPTPLWKALEGPVQQVHP